MLCIHFGLCTFDQKEKKHEVLELDCHNIHPINLPYPVLSGLWTDTELLVFAVPIEITRVVTALRIRNDFM